MIKTLLSIDLLVVFLCFQAQVAQGHTLIAGNASESKATYLPETVSILNSIKIENPSEKPVLYKVYPNPAVDHVNISLMAHQAADIRIEVYDIIGTLAKTEVHSLVNGENIISLGLKDLSKGVYILNIVSGQKKQVVKLVVSR